MKLITGLARSCIYGARVAFKLSPSLLSFYIAALKTLSGVCSCRCGSLSPYNRASNVFVMEGYVNCKAASPPLVLEGKGNDSRKAGKSPIWIARQIFHGLDRWCYDGNVSKNQDTLERQWEEHECLITFGCWRRCYHGGPCALEVEESSPLRGHHPVINCRDVLAVLSKSTRGSIQCKHGTLSVLTAAVVNVVKTAF